MVAGGGRRGVPARPPLPRTRCRGVRRGRYPGAVPRVPPELCPKSPGERVRPGTDLSVPGLTLDFLSGWRDLNPRPLRPEERPTKIYISVNGICAGQGVGVGGSAAVSRGLWENFFSQISPSPGVLARFTCAARRVACAWPALRNWWVPSIRAMKSRSHGTENTAGPVIRSGLGRASAHVVGRAVRRGGCGRGRAATRRRRRCCRSWLGPDGGRASWYEGRAANARGSSSPAEPALPPCRTIRGAHVPLAGSVDNGWPPMRASVLAAWSGRWAWRMPAASTS